MLDDATMRTCVPCGAVLSSWKGRATHERNAHPEWQPDPALRHERTLTKNNRWQATKPRSWHFTGAANTTAKRYGQAPLPRDSVLPDGPCAYCGGEPDGWDHVIPLSRGGPNTVDNLVPACMQCNQRKNRYSPDILAIPSYVTLLCAFCWASVVRKKSELRRIRYAVCSPAHQSAMRTSALRAVTA